MTAPTRTVTQEDAAFIEEAIDRALPPIRNLNAPRTEVVRSIVLALREQGYTITLLPASPDPLLLAVEAMARRDPVRACMFCDGGVPTRHDKGCPWFAALAAIAASGEGTE